MIPDVTSLPKPARVVFSAGGPPAELTSNAEAAQSRRNTSLRIWIADGTVRGHRRCPSILAVRGLYPRPLTTIGAGRVAAGHAGGIAVPRSRGPQKGHRSTVAGRTGQANREVAALQRRGRQGRSVIASKKSGCAAGRDGNRLERGGNPSFDGRRCIPLCSGANDGRLCCPGGCRVQALLRHRAALTDPPRSAKLRAPSPALPYRS